MKRKQEEMFDKHLETERIDKKIGGNERNWNC